jgi:hypothetical protein
LGIVSKEEKTIKWSYKPEEIKDEREYIEERKKKMVIEFKKEPPRALT